MALNALMVITRTIMRILITEKTLHCINDWLHESKTWLEKVRKESEAYKAFLEDYKEETLPEGNAKESEAPTSSRVKNRMSNIS